MKKAIIGIIMCMFLIGMIGFAIAAECINDSDGGINYYEKGYLSVDCGKAENGISPTCGAWAESCKDNKTLFEYNSCENGLNPIEYDCPNGCSDGACIKDNNQVIGGQRDSHGCLTPAGYSYNETEGKCVREWSNGEDRYQEKEDNESEVDKEDNENQTNQGLGQTIRNKVHAGVYTNENGDEIRVSEIAQNRLRLMVKNKSADCDENCNLTEENIGNKSRLRMYMNNGNESEIKIMPNTASEKALERLKLKVCNESNNCTIQLKEVGKGNEKRAAYELQVERHYKLLGMFKAKAMEKAQVDAETGETIIVKKPWWSFLASKAD